MVMWVFMIVKKVWIGIVITLVISSMVVTSVAKHVPNGQAGKSNIAHLYLYEKDPVSWEIVQNGSWGKMKYQLSGDMFDFVFNGHNLTPLLNYSLIYYPDPWPGEGLMCLGSDTSSENGSVHIAEQIETGSLPKEFDDNYGDGAKIWLVLSEDVDCENAEMIGWNPSEYLFEYDLICFNDIHERIVESIEQDIVDDIESNETNEQDVEPENSSEQNSSSVSIQEESVPIQDVQAKSEQKEIKMKFENNQEKLMEVFYRLLSQMYGKGKYDLPSGIEEITSLLFRR
jgi:hypothetical protein